MGKIFPNEKPETRVAIVIVMFFVLALISPELYKKFDEKPIQVQAATEVSDPYTIPQPSAVYKIQSFFQQVEIDPSSLADYVENDIESKIEPFNLFSFFKVRYIKRHNQTEWTEIKESYLVVSDVGLTSPHGFWKNGENKDIFTLKKSVSGWKVIDILEAN